MTSAWGNAWAAAWGNSWGSIASSPDTATTQGQGPGFHLGYRPRKRSESLPEIEAEVIAAIDRANGVETKAERKDAVRELRASARDFVEEARHSADYEAVVQDLDKLLRLQMSAEKFLGQANEIMAANRKQEEDDYQAFMVMAELA